jgi:hypothetical protein
MPQRFEPKFSILPAAQREIWPVYRLPNKWDSSCTAGPPSRFISGTENPSISTFSDPNRWTRINYARRSDLLAAPRYCKTCRTRCLLRANGGMV